MRGCKAQRPAPSAVGDAEDIKVVMGTRKRGEECLQRMCTPACQLARVFLSQVIRAGGGGAGRKPTVLPQDEGEMLSCSF